MTTLRFNCFADWCRHKDDLSPEARHTVEMLLKHAGTSDGDEAERIFSSRTKLSFDDNQISDITPLSGLTNLTKLNLDDNQISNITPLFGLTELYCLNIDNNPIPNLNLLKALQQQWRNLLTEPIARQQATVAIKSAYTSIDQAEPEIIFASSPYAALASLSGCESLGEPLADMLSEAAKKSPSQGLLDWLCSQMAFQLGEELQTQLYQQLRDEGMARGNYYITPEKLVELISITEFCVSEYGSVLGDNEQEALRCLKLLFSSCGYIFPFENVCVVCDRPCLLSLDN